MSGRDFDEGCSSSSAQASGSKRRKVVHTSPKKLNDSLYEFHKPERNPSMQVVFVHGIHSEEAVDAHLSTWESTGKDGLFFWPQEWLAEEFPRAHIFTARYNGGIGERSEGKFDLYQIAENLLLDLLGEKVGQNSSCPVVLVGHCFGGVVIEQLCLHASKPSKDPKTKAFIENLRGIFYYSTPHRGFPSLSEQADRLQTPLSGHLKILGAEGARVNYEFDKLPESDTWRIHGIGENLPTKSALFPDVVAVPEASCRRGNDFRIVVADHISISKPPSKTDTRFYALTTLLHEIASKWEEDSRPENFQRLPKEMIDMQVQVKEIVDKLKHVRILGFCGMGGLGKTTLAKAVFNELNNSNFEYSCFVSDAKLITGTEDDVKKRLWECLHFQGKKVVGGCNLAVLRRKRMLLVLDDVSDRDGKVLLDLAEDTDRGSRFIATSREFDRLDELGDVHKVPYLDSDSAILLFKRHAFRDGLPTFSDVESVLKDIVKKCDGLPLALEVVGNYLRGQKTHDVWRQTLSALEKADEVSHLDERLWAKLRLSFDKLKPKEQQAFLDATNFFVGSWNCTLAEAKAAWSVAYETGGALLWRTLVDMSLVDNVGDNDHITVHEQLRSLGRKIASEPNNKGKYVIFEWNEAPTTFEEKLAAIGQECHALRLADWISPSIPISIAAFHKLKNLRFLEVDSKVAIDGDSRNVVHQCTNLEVPTKLVLLRCGGHSHFNPALQKHLVILDVENLENIPSSIGQLSYLKRLKIGHGSFGQGQLIREDDSPLDIRTDIEHATYTSLPKSFGQLTVLEHLTFDGYLSLRSLPESFGQLKALQHLEFKSCDSLQNLPKSFGQLKALQHLQFIGCSSLLSLPESFGQLKALQQLRFIGCESLRSFPESFGELEALKVLALQRCKSLETLPETLGQLSALERLDVYTSPKLKCLPHSVGQLSNLKYFILEDTGTESLPDTMGDLSALTALRLKLVNVRTLPDSIGNLSALRLLSVREFTLLESLPDSIGQLSALTDLSVTANILRSLPDSIGELSALIKLSIGADKLQSLPLSIGQLSALTKLSISAHELQCLPDSFGQLSALTELSIRADKLQSLPISIGQLSALTELSISAFELQSLNLDSIRRLSALTKLSIRTYKLHSLPDSFGHLSALTELSVESVELQSLPDSFGQLSALTRLSLSHCGKLKSLPESLGKLSSLNQLQLINCCQLRNLPESCGQLTNLKCLSFGLKEYYSQYGSDNVPAWLRSRPNRLENLSNFRTLPNRLGSLPNLQYLQLWGFSAASIPDGVRGMPSLRYVEIMEAERVDEPWPVWLVDKTDPNAPRPVTPRPVDSKEIFQIFEVCDACLFLVEEGRIWSTVRHMTPRGFERSMLARTILHGIEDV